MAPMPSTAWRSQASSATPEHSSVAAVAVPVVSTFPLPCGARRHRHQGRSTEAVSCESYLGLHRRQGNRPGLHQVLDGDGRRHASAVILFLSSTPASVATTVTMYTLSPLESAGFSKLGTFLEGEFAPKVVVSLIADLEVGRRQCRLPTRYISPGHRCQKQ